MRPIGWLLTCLLFTSAISAKVFPTKRGHPRERTDDALVTATFAELRNQTSDTAAAAAAAAAAITDTATVELSNLNWNNNHLGRVEQDEKHEGIVGLGEARTFGHKRIQLMLMPLMYKMGVMMTLLTVLTIISLKGLLIGAILLILKLSTIVGKFTSGWSSSAHHPPAASLPFHGWSSPPSPSSQPIHLHLHNSFPDGHPSNPYNAHGWISANGLDSPEALDRSHIEHYYYKG